MEISTEMLKELREQSGAGVMACRNALIEAQADMEKALEILKQQSLFIVDKKKDRVALQGLIEAYIHTGGRVGAIVEVNCETDFVARTDEFKDLAHNVAMQIAAMNPKYISVEDVPEGEECEEAADCLLSQAYIRDPGVTIRDLIHEVIGKVGENIKVSRFVRYGLGEQ